MQNDKNPKKKMFKFFLVSFLGLLIAAHGVAENRVYDDIAMIEELESFDIEEGNDVEFSESPLWTSEHVSKILVNVDAFGAAGDGVADDTQVNVSYCFQIYLVQIHVIIDLLMMLSFCLYVNVWPTVRLCLASSIKIPLTI